MSRTWRALIVLAVLCVASPVAMARQDEIAPGVTFKTMGRIEDPEAWPSCYTPAETDWASRGGMKLSKRVAAAKADYYLGRVYADRKFTFGPGDALAFRYGDAEIVSLALLTCTTCQQFDLMSTEVVGFTVGDWPPNTGDGGYLVVAAFERGSLRANRRWWKEGPDEVRLVRAGRRNE